MGSTDSLASGVGRGSLQRYVGQASSASRSLATHLRRFHGELLGRAGPAQLVTIQATLARAQWMLVGVLERGRLARTQGRWATD